MIWDSIDFIFRETGLQLRRERLIAIATISTVAVLLLVLGGIVLFLMNVRVWTGRMAQELQVSAYFARDFPRAEAQKTGEDIAKWAEVQSADFVTREESWKSLKQEMPSSARLRGIDNPLSDAVRVRVRNPEQAPRVAKKLEGIEGVRDVVPTAAEAARTGSFAHRVVQVKRAITWAGLIVSILVATAGVFIVHNTVRLALHARWREIYIMQLVGATRAMTASPFLLEGAIHGTLGAAVACCLLVPAHMYLHSLSARVPFFLLAPDRALLPFAVYLIAGGALLGITGSILSIRRYFRRRPEWQK